MEEATLCTYREYKFLILEREIQRDLDTIDRVFEVLGSSALEDTETQSSLIVIAYHLRSLYITFENIFRNIATSFENHLDQDGTGSSLSACG